MSLQYFCDFYDTSITPLCLRANGTDGVLLEQETWPYLVCLLGYFAITGIISWMVKWLDVPSV